MVMMSIVTMRMAAFGMMAIIVPMQPTMKRPKWSIGTHIDFLELVPAKGAPQCAAISSGIKGCGLGSPCPPREIKRRRVMFRFPAPTPFSE